jgi:two-component system, OmpR family, sensor kinase
VLLLAIVALGVPLAINLKARVNAEVKTQAQAQADLVAATAADMLARADRVELATLARTAANSVRGRILIVNRVGGVVADSAGPAQLGSSYESRPEIQAALAGRQIQVTRSSRTLGQQILATAVPIIRDGRPEGAVRVTQSVAAVNGAVRNAVVGLALVGLIVLALGLFAGLVIAGQVGRPIRRLEAVARRIAAGDLGARARVEGSSEQRSLSRSFNEMTDRIARLLNAQRDFVADASHQLRTPLTGVRLRLEEARALEQGRSSELEIDAAIGEVDRLSHTVDDLLVLSSAGERRLAGRDVDLDELARSVAARWRAAAAEQGIALQHASEGRGGWAWAAPDDLDRALDALVENALRYSPQNTRVTIVTAPGRIEVRDRGRGIGADETELVFERFRRGRSGRAGPSGSGLGLPIARELVRRWGGDVTIGPRTGGGTVATLQLLKLGAAGVEPSPGALPAVNQIRTSVP